MPDFVPYNVLIPLAHSLAMCLQYHRYENLHYFMVCDFHGALYRRIYRGVFHYLDFCLSNYDRPEVCGTRQFRYRGTSL